MILKALSKYTKPVLFILFFLFCHVSVHADTLFLRENLKKAKAGDYIVTMQNKTLTLFHISQTAANSVLIEEISIPFTKFQQEACSIRAWLENGAPKYTSWTMYKVDLANGQMLKSYVFMQNGWFEKPVNNAFLTTLLNLRLNSVPISERKQIGRLQNSKCDPSSFWQPKLIFENQWIKDIPFNAWRTKWPNDKSDLAGKTVEIYTPEDSDLYPAYLPYWLEISGMIGNAKIRIIDSGRNLNSPHPFN